MKISTWNVNGIRARQQEVDAWLRAEQPDVICLQEIKAMVDQVPATLCELEGYWCYWHGAMGYSGVGLHVGKALSPERPAFFHPPFDHESRIVAARLPEFTVASVYVPNGGKDLPAKMRFLEELRGWAAAIVAGGEDLVICGDLNVARADIDVHPRERKLGAIGQLPEERALFESFLTAGLRDVARDLEPGNDQLFTWWAPGRNRRQRNIGWRIDYLLASVSLAERATASRSARDVGTSDHAPVTTSFSISVGAGEEPRYRGAVVPPPTGQLGLPKVS
jgi:exodeoxyribonuclease-3